MKKRITILIKAEIIRQAQKHAAQEARSLADLIQDAIVSYLSGKTPNLRKREDAYQLFCERPIRLSKKQFEEILRTVWPSMVAPA